MGTTCRVSRYPQPKGSLNSRILTVSLTGHKNMFNRTIDKLTDSYPLQCTKEQNLRWLWQEANVVLSGDWDIWLMGQQYLTSAGGLAPFQDGVSLCIPLILISNRTLPTKIGFPKQIYISGNTSDPAYCVAHRARLCQPVNQVQFHRRLIQRSIHKTVARQ